jgi:hypothetical protein
MAPWIGHCAVELLIGGLGGVGAETAAAVVWATVCTEGTVATVGITGIFDLSAGRVSAPRWVAFEANPIRSMGTLVANTTALTTLSAAVATPFCMAELAEMAAVLTEAPTLYTARLTLCVAIDTFFDTELKSTVL